VWLLWTWFISSWRAVRAAGEGAALHAGLLLALLYLVAHGMFDVPYWENDLSFEFWALIALQASHLWPVAA
jgi:hypothetical protein